ncbi:lytic transglycosylase [Pseudomonas phage EM]|uniref:Lytic transglycosylase n=1 Tax=Pseudomonas phage EM TaxID=2936914 RepID=A0AAE9KSX9_9CAUD|nr:lytic transglycosylase [Pseudomonas phage EM]UPW35839.1 lytic transglycosylase [Pseudomonas phage EM]
METLEALVLSILLAFIGMFLDMEYSRLKYGTEPVVEFLASPGQIIESKRTLCEYRKPCRLLAEAVYFESRGEPEIGQIAVAHTVINRMKHDRWPSTVAGVLYFKCQYSYTCDGSMRQGITELDKWEIAKHVAYNALYGYTADPTGGADHYLNERKVRRANKGRLPRWARKYKRTIKIGNHTFYKGD